MLINYPIQYQSSIKYAVCIFLDRIDIQCEIMPVPFEDISKAAPGEPSSAIRERGIKARAIQAERFRPYDGIHCNAQMTERMIHLFAEPDANGMNILRTAMDRFSLSARAYSRILKVARTIADLDGSERVEVHHLAEAIGYRMLDRVCNCQTELAQKSLDMHSLLSYRNHK